MKKIEIAVVSASNVVRNSDEVAAVIDALQIQVRRDFAPTLGGGC
jgi:alkyl hydroperoxide reductase subunit AhpC